MCNLYSWLFPRRPGDCPRLGGSGEVLIAKGEECSRRRGRSAYGRETMLLRTSCGSGLCSTPPPPTDVSVSLQFTHKPLRTAPYYFKGHDILHGMSCQIIRMSRSNQA